jgi:pimeloyl-ACP methyl ester carboxylesterase
MAAVGVPRAIVLAHSFAGAIGTALAMDAPERVAGLLLIAPATHPWPGGIAWYYGPGSWPGVDILFSNTLPVAGFALTAEAGIGAVFLPQEPPADYIEATALPLMLRPANFRANAQDVSALLDHVKTRAGRYGAIRQPVVIISGDSDSVVSTSIHSMALAREVSDAKLIVLPGVGHVPHHADTPRVVAELKELSERLLAGK